MAVLENIRVKLGVFISVIIALALLSFIIDPTTLQSVSSSMSSKYNVGVINGKSVSYQDFQKDVEDLTAINQLVSGRSVQGEEDQKQIRNAAWQTLIDKYLFLKKAKAAGIEVGEEEMLALTTGDMISPVLAQSFSDASGVFSSEIFMDFIAQTHESPELKAYWDYLQNTIYTQQFYSKYGALFSASSVSNPLMTAKSVDENNTTTDIEFVMIPFGYAQDSTLSVTDSEIRKYYRAHKDQFRQAGSRDIEYVVFEVKPSADDIAAATTEANALHDEFLHADNMKSFLLRNSERQLSDYWYKSGELKTVSADIDKFVASGKKGAVSPLYSEDNVFRAVKIMDTKMVPDSVYVRHILLQGTSESLVDSLVTVLKRSRSSFPILAAQFSADNNPNVPQRGDIGWMTQNYMIPGMESVMTATVGQIFTLDTQYGKHIVEVTKRTTPINKKRVAILEKSVVPSKVTFNDYYSQASALAVKAAGKYDKFTEAVKEANLYAHPLNRMTEDTDRLGAISHTKEITRWAFGAKKGKASDVITVDNSYFFVVGLKDVHKEGVAPVREVASSINSTLLAEKAGAKKAAEVATQIEGLDSMDAIADVFGAAVSKRENITFASLTTQSLDPKLTGAVSAAPLGEISKPLAGSIAVYVYKVTDRGFGSYYTEDDATARTSQMAQYNLQMLLPVMMEDGKVKDNRARFY